MSEIPDFPDTEKCLGTLLQPLVAHPTHIGNFVVYDYDEQIGDQDTPFIEIHRRGGPLDMATFTDWPVIEVSCWGKSRTVAMDTMRGVVRLVLLNNAGCHFDMGGAMYDSVEDVTGEQESESNNPDDRCVTRTFQFECRPKFD